jgi:hypothetical protein
MGVGLPGRRLRICPRILMVDVRDDSPREMKKFEAKIGGKLLKKWLDTFSRA